MAGHSKWAQIKRQKGATDAKRGQLFTKLGREVTVAAKQGGGDPDTNPRLRLAIDKARDANMPKDTIERAIKRATGEGASAELQEIVYEGYGPGGVAIIIEALTDNRNRTVSDLRYAFTQAGGNLGESGSVAWQFESRGVITFDGQGLDPDEIALSAIDRGAEDVKLVDGGVEVYTTPETLAEVRRALAEGGTEVASADVSFVPKNTISLDARQTELLLRLLDKLDDLDDVQRVSSNADFAEEALAAYA
jgi:YebC/PmpR family DNA-binding regulatory protein